MKEYPKFRLDNEFDQIKLDIKNMIEPELPEKEKNKNYDGDNFIVKGSPSYTPDVYLKLWFEIFNQPEDIHNYLDKRIEIYLENKVEEYKKQYNTTVEFTISQSEPSEFDIHDNKSDRYHIIIIHEKETN